MSDSKNKATLEKILKLVSPTDGTTFYVEPSGSYQVFAPTGEDVGGGTAALVDRDGEEIPESGPEDISTWFDEFGD